MSLHRLRSTALAAFVAAFAASVTAPAEEPAWSATAHPSTGVHGHHFDRVDVAGTGCTLAVTLRFDAPAAGYAAHSESANVYWFEARVQLGDRRIVRSKRFRNRAAGRRRYDFSIDTQSEGCWARTEQPLRRLDVNACRGKVCDIPPFE